MSTTEPLPPPRLRVVIEAWDRLPEAIKEGIVAMVDASHRNDK